jgi:hypothetical protein
LRLAGAAFLAGARFAAAALAGAAFSAASGRDAAAGAAGLLLRVARLGLAVAGTLPGAAVSGVFFSGAGLPASAFAEVFRVVVAAFAGAAAPGPDDGAVCLPVDESWADEVFGDKGRFLAIYQCVFLW